MPGTLSIDDLQQRLKEKDGVVATLTDYLEQAAAKLKELQKQGAAAKPPRAFDGEMVHRQMQLVEQLQAAVEQWQALNTPKVLERLSEDLSAMRDVLANGLREQSPASGSPHANAGGESLLASLTAPKKDGEKDGLSGWEALKAEMLKDEGDAKRKQEESDHVDLEEELAVLMNRPQTVEGSCRDRKLWREAVDSREKYTISLIRTLRVVESRRRGSPDWDSLTTAPVPLRAEVAQLEAELQQTLRTAEVELSIERARISRHESVIAQQEREVNKNRPLRDRPAPDPEGSENAPQGRLQKFLHRG